MLDKFRENARSALIQVAIAAIALVFIFSFGPGSRGCGAPGPSTWAAKVNGEQIPASAFDQAYRQRIYIQKLRRGGSYTVEDARSDNLRAETMKELVERELIAQAGTRQGLFVSDEEIRKEILEADQFKQNGRFDRDLYVRYVANVDGMSPRKFEERLRRDMLAQRMLQLVLDSVSVSEEELRAEYQRTRERASFSYVRFLPAHFRDRAEVADADIDRVLAERKDEVSKRYTDTRYLYVRPRGVKAQRIVAQVKADATTEEESAARKKIDAARAELDKGQSFAEVAGRHSDDAQVDVGWIELGRSAYGKVFEEAALKLAPGKTSEVVRDRFGFHLIHAVEEREPAEQKLEEVERQVAREIALETRARDLARAAAAETLARARAGRSLASQWPAAAAPVDEHGHAQAQPPSIAPEAKTTEPFAVFGGLIPGLGALPNVTAAVFSLGAENRFPADVVEDQNAFWAIELKSRERADFAGFDQEKEVLRERLKGQKRGDLQRAWVEGLREKARVEENADLLAYDTGVRRGVNPNF